MLYRIPIGAIAFAATLGLAGAQAFDESKYPDFAGQWRKPNGVTVQWDQTSRSVLPSSRAASSPHEMREQWSRITLRSIRATNVLQRARSRDRLLLIFLA